MLQFLARCWCSGRYPLSSGHEWLRRIRTMRRFTIRPSIAAFVLLATLVATIPATSATPTSPQAAPSFSDVPASMRPAVDWAAANGIVQGFTPTRFGTTNVTTRAQFATILWRYAGKPAAATSCGYNDVRTTAGYARAACWAKANAYMTGFSATRFGPNSAVTRGQVVAILWRYAGRPEVSTPHGYADVPVSGLVGNAVRWAKAKGVVTAGRRFFSPNAPTIRGHAAVFLYRFEATNNPFGSFDVATTPVPRFAAVRGWTADPNNGTNITPVHIYVDGKFAGAGTTGVTRTDVGRVYPQHGNNTGFEVALDRLEPGNRQVCVYAINTGAGTTNPLLGCRTVNVPDIPYWETGASTMKALLAGYTASDTSDVAGDIVVRVNEAASRPVNRVVLTTPTWVTLDQGESVSAIVRGECVASGAEPTVSRLASTFVAAGFTCADRDGNGIIMGSISLYLRDFAHTITDTRSRSGFWVTYDNNGNDRRSPFGASDVRFKRQHEYWDRTNTPAYVASYSEVSPLRQSTSDGIAALYIDQLAEDPVGDIRIEFTNTSLDFDTNRNLRFAEEANGWEIGSTPIDHTVKRYSDFYQAIAWGECSSDPSFFNGQFGRQEFYPIVAVDNVLTVSGISCDDKNGNGTINGGVSVKATWIDTAWKSFGRVNYGGILVPIVDGECPEGSTTWWILCVHPDDLGLAEIDVTATYTSNGVAGRPFPHVTDALINRRIP